MKEKPLDFRPFFKSSARLLGMFLVAAGCGQEAPAEPVVETYHPLVPGAWWEYQHTNWLEHVEVVATTLDGDPAFTMSDSPNPSDDLRSDSLIAVSNGRVSRMTKEEYLVGGNGERLVRSSVSYGVGFTRWNEDWAAQAVGYKESPEYVRVETPPGGAPLPGEDRKHTFEIMSLSTQVSTPKGTFDCVEVKRTKDWQAEADGVDASDAQTKTFWFARGVGKVQERNEDTGNIELLTNFEIPASAN